MDPMAPEPLAVAAHCDHHYASRLLGGHPLHVRACTLCHTPDWDDLMEQALALYQWGHREGLAGQPPRKTLSAYDKPQEAPQSPCTGFPDNCPNLRAVEPGLPRHEGGIRCGCGDDTTAPPASHPQVTVYGIDVSEWDRMWEALTRIEAAVTGQLSKSPAGPSSPLRDEIATAVRSVLYRDLSGDMSEHVADAVLTVVLPHGKFLGDQLRDSEERLAETRGILDEVLRHFVHKGHPGEPCLQSGRISEKTVARWRAVLHPQVPAASQDSGRPHAGSDGLSGGSS